MHITRKWRRKWYKQLQYIQDLVRQGLGQASGMLHCPKLRQAWQRQLIATSIIAGLAGCSQVYALPQNGQVVDGSGTISQQGKVLNVNQNTNKMIVDWQSFNIAKGESVNFVQPNAAAVALNRVLGNDASSIYGALNANGKVFLINPNGIVFGSSAQVNTGSLVASTLNMNNADFMAGRYSFNGSTGKIENSGNLVAGTGGSVTLIAPQIANKGVIVAEEGSVSLAAGDKVTLGDSLIAVAVNKAAVNTAIENGGLIKASGGQIIMNSQTASNLASSLINTGTLEAGSITKQGGVISLTGDHVTVGGKVTADGTTGGRVDIAGDDIKLAKATISANGTTGGGTIRVGGDYQGTGTFRQAATLSVDKDVSIKADAGKTGNGGKVVLWSDAATTFSGSISARGGEQSGNGGTVEVSGKKNLSYDGVTNTLAAHGQAGSLLLDPANVVIADSGGTITPGTITANLNTNGTFTVQTGTSAAGGDGDIVVNSAITNSNANKTLILKAYRNITVNDNITLDGTGSNITLRADSTGNGSGTVRFASGKKLTVNTTADGGEIKIQYNPADYTADQTIFDTNMSAYSGHANTYYLINGLGTASDAVTAKTLGALSNNSSLWSKNYALGKNLDARDTLNWNSGSGFSPIGNAASNYTGKFDGNGQVINGLYINRPTSDGIGLFGYTNNAVISNLGMIGGSITGSNYVGGLVGNANNALTINSSYNTNSVTSRGNNGVGGLVGGSGAGSVNITSSYNTGNVSGNSTSGGLIGSSANATILSSYNTGSVSSAGNQNDGGLIGSGGTVTITSSYNTGAVGESHAQYIGGLVGSGNNIRITSSYNTSSVIGANFVGGLVGGCYNSSTASTATITSSYNSGSVTGVGVVDWTGYMNGGENIGGLVGNMNKVTIESSYNIGSVSGKATVGGLVGSSSTIDISSSYNGGGVIGTVGNGIGGLIGEGTTGTITSSFWATDAAGTTTTYTRPRGACTFSADASQTLATINDKIMQSSDVWRLVTGRAPVLKWQRFTLTGTSDLGAGIPIALIRDGVSVATTATDAAGNFSFTDVYEAGNYLVAATGSDKAGYSAYISSLSDGIMPGTAQAGSFFNISLAKNTVITRNGTDTLVKALGSTAGTGIAYSSNTISTDPGISLQTKNAYNLTTGSEFGAYLLNGNVTSGGSQIYDSVTVGYGDKILKSASGVTLNNLLAVNRLAATPTTAVTLTLDDAGAVNGTNGAILTDNLLLKGTGRFTLDGNNLVAALATSGVTGAIEYNNQGSLALGTLNTGSDNILVKANGNITLNAGTTISTVSTSSTALQLVAQGGNFVNASGSAAPFSVNGSWQVYSADPRLDTLGGINSYDYKQYNIHFGDGIYAANKNAFLYSLAPTLTVTSWLTGTYEKIYDGATTVNTDALRSKLTVSGVDGINGDTCQTYSLDGTKISFDTRNAGTGKTIMLADGWLQLAYQDTNGKAVYGYRSIVDRTTTTGNITPKAITITPEAGQSGTYNGMVTPNTPIRYTNSGLASGDTGFAGELQLDSRNAGENTIINNNLLVADNNGGANYTYTYIPGVKYTVIPKTITITPEAGQSGTYNGTVTPDTPIRYTNSGLASGDTGFTGDLRLNSRNAGTATIISNNLLVADGNGGANYTYSFIPGVAYTVNRLDLPVTGLTALNKVWDGSASATLQGTASVTPISSDDVVLVGSPQGFFTSAAEGRNKPITITGLTLSGADADNYNLVQSNGLTANITSAALFPDNPPREQRDSSQLPAGPRRLADNAPGLPQQVVVIQNEAVNISSESDRKVVSFLAKVNLEGISTGQTYLTLSDGHSAVPEWLQFDEKTMTLIGVNIPEGALPLTVIVHASGKETPVTIENNKAEAN